MKSKEDSRTLEDYVDIKFGSIYYAIKSGRQRLGQESRHRKGGGNPERYIYQIMPAGRKYYKKMLKQYFDHTMIHFDIDIVLMFYNSLMPEQKEAFIEDRMEAVKEKLVAIKDKVDEEMKLPEEKSHIHVFTYLENHLKAELACLSPSRKGSCLVGHGGLKSFTISARNSAFRAV